MKMVWLILAWLVALSGTVLSILYGEVFQNTPCSLCWYQRSMLFSLAILLTIAVYRGDVSIRPYALALALVGLFFASYQVFLPKGSALCGAHISCSEQAVMIFGSIPLTILSMVGFLLLSFFLVLVKK